MSRGQVLPLRRVDGTRDELSDEALIASCAVDDSAALGALFDRHHRHLHRFIRRATGVDEEAAEDLLQETFVEVWRSAARFKGNSKVKTWIFGIAANVIRHHRRSESRRSNAMSKFDDLPKAVRAPCPEDIAAGRESLRRVQQALDRLSPERRIVFVMCDLEGIPGVEAARVLGVRPGTVWRRRHEARHALRDALKERGAS